MLDLFFDAAWQVALAGLLFGAGLPVLFALGVRWSAQGSGQLEAGGQRVAAQPGFRVLGGLCFAVVALTVVLGIGTIVAAGFGKQVSFDSGYPTFVDKA